MLIFWGVVAMLLIGCLLLLLPPLWAPRPDSGRAGANVAVYRDQLHEAERDFNAGLLTPERMDQLQGELRRRVLEDADAASGTEASKGPARRTAMLLAVLVPAASLMIYLTLGRPGAVAPADPALVSAGGGRHQLSGLQIEAMVSALAERMKAEPNNAEGWLMLGRSYTSLGRYRDAATALRKAQALLPGNAGVLTDLADVLAMVQGKKLAGEPSRYIQQALDLDPRHIKALALAGSVAFEARDYGNARSYWERLIAVAPAESDIARSARGSIAQATRLEANSSVPANAAARASLAPTSAPANAPNDAVPPAGISGEVVLSPELAARVAAGDTVYVFARAVQGPRLPLAILKQPAGTWPLNYRLDDSMAMAPDLKLSTAAQVVVGARVSRSGNATPQSGDLIGQSAPVTNRTQGLRIVIDRVQP